MTEPSTTQRDDLARDIFLADNSSIPEGELRQDWTDAPDHHRPYAQNIADGLIAKGYRKRRTITTVEELDALPDGSVVMGFKQNGDQRVSTKSFGDWFVDGSEEDYPQAGLGHACDELTVLHQPEAEATR